jgi:hypothetical protein
MIFIHTLFILFVGHWNGYYLPALHQIFSNTNLSVKKVHFSYIQTRYGFKRQYIMTTVVGIIPDLYQLTQEYIYVAYTKH